jgi:hypothetical protein
MKEALAAFAVSFGLSLGLVWLSYERFGFATLFSVSLSEAIPFFDVTGMLFDLVLLAVFFGVFYFLAIKFKMRASRPTVLALLLGVVLGSGFNNLLFISPQYYNTFTLIFIASSSFEAVFEFFLPSVIALLFVELKHEQANRTFPPS